MSEAVRGRSSYALRDSGVTSSACALRGSGGTSPPVRCVALAKQGVGYTPKRFNLTRELE